MFPFVAPHYTSMPRLVLAVTTIMCCGCLVSSFTLPATTPTSLSYTTTYNVLDSRPDHTRRILTHVAAKSSSNVLYSSASSSVSTPKSHDPSSSSSSPSSSSSGWGGGTNPTVANSINSGSSSSNGGSSSELYAVAVPYDDSSYPTVRSPEKRKTVTFEETTVRSAVKALVWRLVAGSITFVTSYKLSNSLAYATTIVSSDFCSKAFTMFIGERIFNKSQAGRKSGSDGAGRSLAKALIWRLFAIVNTLSVALFVSKDISVASKIAGLDAIFKTALMFVYERIWAKIQWGKVEI